MFSLTMQVLRGFDAYEICVQHLLRSTNKLEKAKEFLKRVLDQIDSDPDHDLKVIRARERYKFINKPK